MNSRNMQLYTVIMLIMIVMPCMYAKPCSSGSSKVINELENKLLDDFQADQTKYQQFLTTTTPVPSTPLVELEEHMEQDPYSTVISAGIIGFVSQMISYEVSIIIIVIILIFITNRYD